MRKSYRVLRRFRKKVFLYSCYKEENRKRHPLLDQSRFEPDLTSPVCIRVSNRTIDKNSGLPLVSAPPGLEHAPYFCLSLYIVVPKPIPKWSSLLHSNVSKGLGILRSLATKLHACMGKRGRLNGLRQVDFSNGASGL
ncbi:hypothetical protein TSUD_335440 [Trifolium subterraneum]|uniref:Uncharacterized protein n=1 Tax=Trifolium subterraneum TaxID=3900 RepID=A0A2Z6LMF8_TRISU|nr:hypothetical protein TSUD_335440 [Trifolium subterraneum]